MRRAKGYISYDSKYQDFLLCLICLSIVVAPSQFHFGHTKGRGDVDLVNITCAVDHAYPEPSLKIYQGEGKNR